MDGPLQVQYKKIPSSEHGENMLCTEIIFDIQNNFCTQLVLPMFCKKKSFWQKFTCNSQQSGWNHVLKNLNSFPNMSHMNFCEKETKNEVCFSWSWRRMFFQSNFELVFMALGHILPDLILGNCVQKCISWILPIISNEPFMTQDELRTWKIILRALQILPIGKSRAVDWSTIPFLSIFGVLPTEMCD